MTTKGSPSESLPDLLDLSLDDARRLLDDGTITSEILTQAYLARIRDVDGILKSVIQVNPDAIEIARKLDSERAAGSSTGFLHGLPILVKDNIATGDRMNTTAGSFALYGARTGADATVVRKLREAGAVILGKTNLSQWANYRSTDSSNGWSAVGGQTLGAYHALQDPSGSSSGSGVAPSVGLCFVALGSETCGSIISPANVNNLVGIKPTVGLTSRHLCVPISSHQDTVGPMARTVKDAAAVLQVIAGGDADHDAATAECPKSFDYLGACKSDGLRGKRIGIPRQLIDLEKTPAYEIAALDRAIALAKEHAAEVRDVEVPSIDRMKDKENKDRDIVLNNDFVRDLPGYFSQLQHNPHCIKDLKDVLEFTKASPLECGESRNTELWEDSLKREYHPAALDRNVLMGGKDGIEAALASMDGDVLMILSSASPEIASYAGHPIITVPLGFAPFNTPVVYNKRKTLVATGPHVPFGISFIGRRFSEELLIEVAYAFEQLTHARMLRKPLVCPQTQLRDVLDSAPQQVDADAEQTRNQASTL
ncbi:hypothetical protein PYCC9005_002291 [Savitreella phatthalungensis]